MPALRSGCACSLPSVGIAHLTSLNSPCLTGHIASTTNDKLYLSSASVLFLLADANSSYTIFFGTPIFFGVRPGACLSDSSPHHTQCTQTFIPHARIHLSAHAPRQPDISCFLVMLHRSPPSRRLSSRPPPSAPKASLIGPMIPRALITAPRPDVPRSAPSLSRPRSDHPRATAAPPLWAQRCAPAQRLSAHPTRARACIPVPQADAPRSAPLPCRPRSPAPHSPPPPHSPQHVTDASNTRNTHHTHRVEPSLFPWHASLHFGPVVCAVAC